jgi:hypothetical protein
MQANDGFEGIGLLVEGLSAMFIIAVTFPIVSACQKLLSKERAFRIGSVWPALIAYCLSLSTAGWFMALCLTDEVFKTAASAWVGSLIAFSSLVFAFRARGAGRWTAVIGSSYLSLLWLPFLYGRGFKL